MEPRKLTKADIDKVRHIEGFPIARTRILLRFPMLLTIRACPNPFIEDLSVKTELLMMNQQMIIIENHSLQM